MAGVAGVVRGNGKLKFVELPEPVAERLCDALGGKPVRILAVADGVDELGVPALFCRLTVAGNGEVPQILNAGYLNWDPRVNKEFKRLEQIANG